MYKIVELLNQLREKQNLFGFAQKDDEVDQIISEMEEVCLLNEKFYLINEHGKFLKKIKYVKNETFEWESGWAYISQLKPNEGKVKYLLDLT